VWRQPISAWRQPRAVCGERLNGASHLHDFLKGALAAGHQAAAVPEGQRVGGEQRELAKGEADARGLRAAVGLRGGRLQLGGVQARHLALHAKGGDGLDVDKGLGGSLVGLRKRLVLLRRMRRGTGVGG
jgi:hypothetical protein